MDAMRSHVHGDSFLCLLGFGWGKFIKLSRLTHILTSKNPFLLVFLKLLDVAEPAQIMGLGRKEYVA